jgi:hypothetical protein
MENTFVDELTETTFQERIFFGTKITCLTKEIAEKFGEILPKQYKYLTNYSIELGAPSVRYYEIDHLKGTVEMEPGFILTETEFSKLTDDFTKEGFQKSILAGGKYISNTFKVNKNIKKRVTMTNFPVHGMNLSKTVKTKDMKLKI